MLRHRGDADAGGRGESCWCWEEARTGGRWTWAASEGRLRSIPSINSRKNWGGDAALLIVTSPSLSCSKPADSDTLFPHVQGPLSSFYSIYAFSTRISEPLRNASVDRSARGKKCRVIPTRCLGSAKAQPRRRSRKREPIRTLAHAWQGTCREGIASRRVCCW